MCGFGRDQKPTDGKSNTVKVPSDKKQLQKETEKQQMSPQGNRKGILKKTKKGKNTK